MKRKIDLNSEYMRFDTREAMLRHFIKSRLIAFVGIFFLHVIVIFLVVGDTRWSIEIFSTWVLIYVFIFICAYIFLYFKCKKYVYTFFHMEYAWTNIVSSVLMLVSMLVPLFYCAYMYTRYIILIPILLFLVASHTIYFAIGVKLEVKNKFSKVYFQIGSIPFFAHDKYMDGLNTSQWMSKNIVLCSWLLGIAGAAALTLRSFDYPSWAALSASLTCCIMFFILSPYLLIGIYPYFFVHPKVEQKFRSPLRSDVWGFFELDPELAEKTFGKDAVKRPIQYAEVFGDTPEVF